MILVLGLLSTLRATTLLLRHLEPRAVCVELDVVAVEVDEADGRPVVPVVQHVAVCGVVGLGVDVRDLVTVTEHLESQVGVVGRVAEEGHAAVFNHLAAVAFEHLPSFLDGLGDDSDESGVVGVEHLEQPAHVRGVTLLSLGFVQLLVNVVLSDIETPPSLYLREK